MSTKAPVEIRLLSAYDDDKFPLALIVREGDEAPKLVPLSAVLVNQIITAAAAALGPVPPIDQQDIDEALALLDADIGEDAPRHGPEFEAAMHRTVVKSYERKMARVSALAQDLGYGLVA